MKWVVSDCRPGDMIRIEVGSVYHYGIFCSEDEVIEFGEAPEGSLFRDFEALKVISVDIDEFACGHMVEVAKLNFKEKLKRFSPKKTVEIARSKLGEGGYDLMRNNCEHFANYCVFGVKRCTQEEGARIRWKNRSFFDVYIAAVPDKVEVEAVYPKLRQREISAAKNEKVKKEKFFVWQLLSFAVKESLGCDIKELNFSKTKNGKWLCDKCFFSLSHTNGFAAVAISDKPVGVDIENTGDFKSRHDLETLLKLAKRVGIEISGGDEGYDDFLKGWTKKESIFKCIGEGNFIPSQNTEYPCETHNILGCRISFCGECLPISIIWQKNEDNTRTMITPDDS